MTVKANEESEGPLKKSSISVSVADVASLEMLAGGASGYVKDITESRRII